MVLNGYEAVIIIFFGGNPHLKVDGASHVILFSEKDPKQEFMKFLGKFSIKL